MKILCDVCDKGEASFYCTADEASLCSACDHRVHHANKLAGKHQRFSLLHPSPKHSPLCDICQEKSAFLFCQQDRAILCRECDASIHKANPHTQSHTRFLLTGVTISASPALYSDSPSESASTSNASNDAVSKGTPPPAKGTTAPAQEPSQFSTSSISEYLIETLPGWHVEDLLDSSSPSPFSKSGENDLVLPFWEGDFHGNNSINTSGFPTGIWVPQIPLQNQSFQLSCLDNSNGKSNSSNNLGFGFKEFAADSFKSTRKASEDNSFAVPQISPSLSKRSRNYW